MLLGNTSFGNHLEVWTGLMKNIAPFLIKTYQNKAATFQTIPQHPLNSWAMDGHPTAEKAPIKKSCL